MNQKRRIRKSILKVFKCFDFCFRKFVIKNTRLAFFNMIFEFFKKFFRKIRFSLL